MCLCNLQSLQFPTCSQYYKIVKTLRNVPPLEGCGSQGLNLLLILSNTVSGILFRAISLALTDVDLKQSLYVTSFSIFLTLKDLVSNFLYNTNFST